MAAALLGSMAIVAAGPAAARPRYDSRAAMEQALRLHGDLEDARASALLHELLRHGPPMELAAEAHLYLGIIALDALRVEEARAEFEQAIRIDPTLEPPLNSSPKARALYRDVRNRLATANPEAPAVVVVPAPSPPSLAPAPVAPPPAVQAAPESPSRVPAYVAGGIGLACLAAGIGLGIASNGPASQATSPGLGEYATTAVAAAQTASSERVAADVLFGAALAAGVTSVVLFFTEKPRAAKVDEAPAGGIVPVWGGAAFVAAGHF